MSTRPQGLNHDIVGVPTSPYERSWNGSDAMLYALSVGSGAEDPTAELSFTTENTRGVQQCVLPTFPVVLVRDDSSGYGDFDPARLVHAEQALTLHGPLPVAGTVTITSAVTGIYDKGSGALILSESRGVDPVTGVPLFTCRESSFLLGEGGFGGDRGSSEPWTRPDREADIQTRFTTRPEQALLYRLNGDRNPLHTDPQVAAQGGFERPILHGLCTFGFAGRALLGGPCDGDPLGFGSISGRFSAPVIPGDELVTSIWLDGERALFQTAKENGTVVIDRGIFESTAIAADGDE